MRDTRVFLEQVRDRVSENTHGLTELLQEFPASLDDRAEVTLVRSPYVDLRDPRVEQVDNRFHPFQDVPRLRLDELQPATESLDGPRRHRRHQVVKLPCQRWNVNTQG